jgi:3-methyladenine DNA glycosylase AlkD
LKAGFSFSDSDREEQAKIWDYVWHHSDCYEVMSLALGWYEHKKQADLLVKDWPKLKKWSVRVDNWAHSDSLSGLYARILEGEPSLVYPAFETWNRSKNPWLRRLSIVSLLYYSSQRKSVLPFKEIISLIEPQIEFDHYYVQKGVGWALRETGNVYPAETYQFLEGNVRRLSAAAFSAATEKITKTRKDRLKRLRKG